MNVSLFKSKGKFITLSVVALFVLSTILFLITTNAFSESLEPDETVSTYYDHASNGNIDEAKKYISEEVIKVYSEDGGTSFSPSLKNAILKEGKEYTKVEPIKETVEISNQTASVDVKVYKENGFEKTETYNLIKENGEWKITFQ